VLPAFFGLKGPVLDDEERAFFLSTHPAGYILFARNIETPEQVRQLTEALKELHGEDHLPILIDQEGGRVARLKPPHWSTHPPSNVYGSLYETDKDAAHRALNITGQIISAELLALGITIDCLPVLDVPQSDADPIIGDRAYAFTPDKVSVMGRWAAQSLLENGVIPVIKHIPGHGRALVDSHLSLPEVKASIDELRAVDFPPFKALSGMPMAMTAHVVYKAIDPENCATLSKTVIQDIIRGELGFDGLLMSDDLSMKALSGGFETRAKRAHDAGCDIILHCNGDMAEMQAIAAALPSIDEKCHMRLQKAMLSATSAPIADRLEIDALIEERAALLGLNKE
jgi:beta-N-acetylhexosaminidase